MAVSRGVIAQAIHDQLDHLNLKSEFAVHTLRTCARETIELVHGKEQEELMIAIATQASLLANIELIDFLALNDFPISSFYPKIIAFEKGGLGHKVTLFERHHIDSSYVNIDTECGIFERNLKEGEIFQATGERCPECYPPTS